MILMRAFAMVEMLLVIAIAASILMFSLNRYHYYHRITVMRQISANVNVLMSALNRYFHQQGCARDGYFVGNLQPSIITDLNDLSPINPNIFKSNEFVLNYALRIYPTDSQTDEKKPIYKLAVDVNLQPGLNSKLKAWLLRRLQGAILRNNTLEWQSLPATTHSEPGNNFWVLSPSREIFRKMEQARAGHLTLTAFSYCAH